MNWFLAGAVAVAMGLAASSVGGFDLEQGRQIYDQHCAGCHGSDGVANLPGAASLRGGQLMMRTDPEILAIIRYGVQTMPGFDAILDREGLLNVLFYIRSLDR